MFIKEIMTKDVITVSPDASLKEVGSIFKEKRISGVPVVNRDGYIVGIVTLTDLLKILGQIYRCKELEDKFIGLKLSKMHEEEKTKAKVRDIMTKDVVTISEDRTIDDVIKLMFDKDIHTFPVIKEDKLIGIVGKRDLLDASF